MFQPQATPYSPFSSYGAAAPIHDFSGFQQSAGQVVDSGGPTVFRDPIFSTVGSNINTSRNLIFSNNNSNHNNARQYKMAGNDLEEQESLARNFQPALEGPLVGEKKSSQAIAEEYAKADPVYVAKTAALPQKYSHYRQILGDGNCGWRAAGYSYFEALIHTGQRSRLEEEVARMISLNNLLTTAGGFDAWLFEDMVEETTTLLKDLSSLIDTSPQDAEAVLRQRFNDPSVSNSIVYHFKLLASSWLKANAATYEGFIGDGNGVDAYRKNYLEPVNTEIEHLGMTLLIDVLLKPIGISVEIVYLDRSEGSQVNTHLIQAEEPNGTPSPLGSPTIHLLYRPSHYDILYRDQVPLMPFQAVAPGNSVQINRATSFTQQHMVQSTPMAPTGDFSYDMSILSCIPGFSLPPTSRPGYAPLYQSPPEQSYTSSVATSASPVSPGGSSSTTTPPANPLPSYQPQSQAMPLRSPPLPSPTSQIFPAGTQLPILSHIPPHRASLPSELTSPSSATSFRPSKYEYAAAVSWPKEQPQTFQTSTFKNSHYNTAHYNNPNFQPEEWTPDCEDLPVRKKSS